MARIKFLVTGFNITEVVSDLVDQISTIRDITPGSNYTDPRIHSEAHFTNKQIAGNWAKMVDFTIDDGYEKKHLIVALKEATFSMSRAIENGIQENKLLTLSEFLKVQKELKVSRGTQ